MNPVLGEAALKLKDGRTLTLVLDFEALVAAETAYGKPLAQTLADANAGFVGATRSLLFGTLQAKHPEMSLREATSIFMSDGEAVSAALEAASIAAYPAEDKESGKAPAARPRRGKNSGSNGAKQA